MTGHNLPRSVFPHPDIRETKCSAEGGAFLVFACGGHVTCRNRKVLAIHPHVEGGIGRDGGDYSFDFYMETKNISVATTDHRVPLMGLTD